MIRNLKRWNRFLLVMPSFLLLLIACQNLTMNTITDVDKAEVIRLTLERALLAREIPDYGLIADKANIVLSTENFDAAWLPQLEGVNIILLDSEALQAKADQEGDFLYLRFQEIEIRNNRSMIVSLDNVWAVSKSTTHVYLSGGGFHIEYHRENGKWIGQITSIWIS